MAFVFRHLQGRQHAAVGSAVVAVMEQGDIPAPAQLVEEVEQRTRALRKLKAEHALVRHCRGVPADGMANVQLGQFVVGQVDDREPLATEIFHQCSTRVVLGVGLHADEDVRLAILVVAVVEFGDLALADRLAEGLEAARLLRNGDSDDRFALFTQFCTFRHMAQAIEVDVGARIDAHQNLAADALTFDVLLDSGHGQRTGGLGDRAGVVVDILDCRTDFVGADGDHFIDAQLADIEGVLADLRHRHAVGEQPDLRQHHALTRGQRLLQAVGVVRLDADDLGLRAQVFDVSGDAGDQAATTDRYEDRVQRALMLAQDFHCHGALAGDHMGVVVGVHVDQALLLDQL